MNFSDKVELLLADIRVLETEAALKTEIAKAKRAELVATLKGEGVDGFHRDGFVNVTMRATRSVKVADEAATIAALAKEAPGYLAQRTVLADHFKADVLDGKIAPPGVEIVEREALQIRFANAD